MTAVSGVVFAALAVILLKWLDLGPVRHPELFAAIMLTVFVSLAWCVTMFRRADDEATLDESSIAYRVPGRATLIMSWPEITRVRARDLLQRLELTDVTGTRRIVLAYQMENFARLRRMIRERTRPPAPTGPPQRVFAKSLAAILLPLHWPVVFVIVAAWFWRQGGSPYAPLFTIAWGVWTLLGPPWRVRLLDDAVAVDYLGRSRRIGYAEIVEVREDRKDTRNLAWRCDTPFWRQRRLARALQRSGGRLEAGWSAAVTHRPCPAMRRPGLKRRADDRGRDARAWSADPCRASEMAAAPSATAAAPAA